MLHEDAKRDVISVDLGTADAAQVCIVSYRGIQFRHQETGF